ncbi:MAG: hypothetical protein JW915_18955 [Chitinispirillaceae bacterium]|nr:hypothetical protein [Chitinispirillaceae bacterium]
MKEAGIGVVVSETITKKLKKGTFMKPLLQGILFFALLIQCGIPGVSEPETKTEINDSSFTPLSVFADAFSKHRSDFQVKQEE